MSKNVNIGGRLKFFQQFWASITEDKHILGFIKGAKLDFDSVPYQKFPQQEIFCSLQEKLAIDDELEKYLDLGIISRVHHTEGEFISKIFTRPKKNGKIRIILDLSILNKNVRYEHFKMENFNTALALVSKNCYFASIDLQDAYYSVSIDWQFKKYLRFTWKNNLFEFNCLPNGYSGAPRLFTKLMKPIFGKLRSEGYLSVYYLDDSLQIGNSFEECRINVFATAKLLSEAGFIINTDKSVAIPSQKILFLGFWIDSVEMTVTLPVDKQEKILGLGNKLLDESSVKIRVLAQFIGLLVSSLPAIKFGALFYRYLECNKIIGLKDNFGNFEKFTMLSDKSKEEISWWLENVQSSPQNISIKKPDFILECDASNIGWGVRFGDTSAQGHWLPEETDCHINVLELKAVFFGLKSFFNDSVDIHIRVKSDNTTAVAYINNFGGVKSLNCHEVAKEIWLWAIDRRIHVSAEHLPGSQNILADKASRIFDKNTEWELDQEVFKAIEERFGVPDIDLFASRINKKCNNYASWKPDPFSKIVDAFSASWFGLKFYAFPPFSMVLSCIQKIRAEQATGILVVPLWITQPWFPLVMRMLVQPPVVSPLGSLFLSFQKETQHLQHKNLRMMACHLSGDITKSKDFHLGPLTSCVPHGEPLPKINIKFILKNGVISVVDRRLIPCSLLKRKS